ncbi:MAG TPA: choice-of-anchor Q domain-containing protein [Candidatus Sulfotelmatobacter sp.]|nr:choice-of-anchor Q domain-containing protein [Candidatus Sulfotelmatobacter sp.]
MKCALGILPLFAALFLSSLYAHAQGVTHYVDLDCTNPVPPYTDWTTAATNIQNAVDAASPGDLVLVTNGVYSSGGRIVSGTTTNCIVVTNAITVQSVNGPSLTIIQAYPSPGLTNGSQRCAYLGTGSILSGFTLMNGSATNDHGGGIYCNSGNCIVSNCVIAGNWAQSQGGGGYGGTYYYCLISSNGSPGSGGGVSLSSSSAVFNCLVNSNNASGSGGGIYSATGFNPIISNCVITCNFGGNGGGGCNGSYYNCIISSNSCADDGGGLDLTGSVLNNCLIADNFCLFEGGGIYAGGLTMVNCTVAKNFSYDNVGGIYAYPPTAYLTNSIVCYNTVSAYTPQPVDLAGTVNLCNCCVTNVGGVNDIVAPPGFVNVDGSDFQLAAWSPCIDAGTNSAVTSSVDLAGNPRIVNGTVDIGAYEYQYQFTNLIRYVSLNNSNATPPFTNWTTAASNIQSAIDIANPSDFIVVSNGIYNKGGRLANDETTNRIVVNVPVTVQALSGTADTFIQGGLFPNYSAMRCAYVTNGATLIGFTLTNGYSTGSATNNTGGGVWCESSAATIISCDLAYNEVQAGNGGGAYSGTLIDCLFSQNYARSGGGAYSSTLVGCVLTNNFAPYGAGAFFGVLSNCSLVDNIGTLGAGTCSNVLYNCLVVSNSSDEYGGGAYSCILSNSTLLGNKATMNGGGAYSSTLANCTLIGNIATNTGGGAYSSTLSDCTLTENWATNGGAAAYGFLFNCTLTDNTALDNGGGVLDSTLTNCILLANIATNGGGAFGATLSDCLISSNSGLAYGGGTCFGTLSNCAISNNAAGFGGGVASNTLYNCTVAFNKASLQGGGSYAGTLNNCLILSNVASAFQPDIPVAGGGSCLSVLNSCDLFNNVVSGSGSGTGGGACAGVLSDCILSNNVASGVTVLQPAYGGGAANAILTNCLVINNRLDSLNGGLGGGAYDCYLNNCTIASNAAYAAGVVGGGATNCIIYYNVGVNSNWYSASSGTFVDCCTAPLPTTSHSLGNFTNAPLFVSTNDFHLQSNSPCINSGNNAYVATGTDLDGNPRIVGGTVDVGAYEYQTPTSVISYAYLQNYGLPTDGSVDYADLDGTAFDVYEDWIAGLNPTNPASVLAMFPPPATNNISGLTISWQSVSGIFYNLQRSTNLSAQPAFQTIHTNIPGQTGTTAYTDTSATNDVPYFYRVNVP